ncbi:MAG: hypothetical protein IIC75_08670 [Bacteroidetes bacterium]|nr:hypothetical protein [Bacteroidota bacterium]
MKKTIILLIILISLPVFSQFKNQNKIKESVSDGIVNKQYDGGLFGIFNSKKFQMSHIYNLSFSASGDNQLAVGSYTNQLFYKFNNKLNFQLWTSIVTTPYKSFNNNSNNNFDGIYIDKASINYKPLNNFMIQLQFSNNPYRHYNSFYNYNRYNRFSSFIY